MTDLSRRDVLAAGAAAGLTLAFTVPGETPVAGAATAFEPNTWLTINPDGAITVHVAKAEMGQGIGTALAQIVAEELEADWKDIRIAATGARVRRLPFLPDRVLEALSAKA